MTRAIAETGAASSVEPWLTCRGVAKSYNGVVALAGVDIDLHAGEVHGLIGPNGAGKSTLVKILTGATRPDEGVIEVNGDRIELRDPADAQRHRLVLMPQELAVVPAASVVDNVTLGAEATTFGFRSAGKCRQEAREALDAVGLDVDLDLKAGLLGSAHQRLLMMARVLHRQASLLILDEPTAGLPQLEAELIGEAVRRLLNRQLTIVYVSHHLTEVAALSNRVSCVREGRIVATLTSEDVHVDALVSAILGTPGSPMGDPSRRQQPSARPPSAGAVEFVGVTGSRLKDVSLRAHRGEVTGITGLLGSGVSELVSILVGADRPARGELRVDGKPVSFHTPADALDHGVGYLAGDRGRAAFTTLTIRENVSLAALRRWFGRLGIIRVGRERAKVHEQLDVLSVQADPERPFGTLSGGNQQRALVARLLAAQLDILVLDEPTVGVDVVAREQLWSTIRTLAADHAVVVASSEPDELVALCDRVMCIHDGSLADILVGSAVTEHNITRAVT